ncbi:hypothetical protein CYLTODRAFT_416572 [Cylindrobasidium torrendii FP15055 ss-10]|uniref:DUF7330 domain-containing protein n=1 Tax=Cylindrobasidium torrendii FP15055 ss-10 TaxID=1314674 RepID=A0A0D7BUR2_9AGAR|nr:hypothetical protein CYLTODRAFT_416572 [Cylindrobasidium torrendii FP15055 ss-10]
MLLQSESDHKTKPGQDFQSDAPPPAYTEVGPTLSDSPSTASSSHFATSTASSSFAPFPSGSHHFAAVSTSSPGPRHLEAPLLPSRPQSTGTPQSAPLLHSRSSSHFATSSTGPSTLSPRPRYSEPPSPRPIPSPQSSLTTPSTPKTGATNFVNVYRYFNDITGSFFVDPTLQVHPSLLAPLPEGEVESNRKNLNFGTMAGVIQVEVTIVQSAPIQRDITRPPRCTIQIKNKLGLSMLRLHAPDARQRLPIFIRMWSRCGPLRLYLSRSFVGVLTVSGSIAPIFISDRVAPYVHSMDDTNGSRRYFFGDMASCPWNSPNEKTWMGDECVLESLIAPIHLAFDDE